MRMRDLVERTGVPRTTIHHYLREGLLPPPEKTSANAAVYTDAHVERLRLVAALRGDELGPHAIGEIRRILALVDAGVDPAVAGRLEALTTVRRSGAGEVSRTFRGASEVAREARVSLSTVRRLIDAGLLLARRAPGGDRDDFDVADVEMTRAYAELMGLAGLDVPDLAPVAQLLAELVRYEDALARVATSGRQAGDVLRIQGVLERCMRAAHAYVLARAAAHGEG